MTWVKILIAYDGSACADAALESLPRAGLPQDAEALSLFVVAKKDFSPGRLADGPKDSSKARATDITEFAGLAANRVLLHFPGWKISSDAVAGSPADVVLKTVNWWRPDLLVVACYESAHGDSSSMVSASMALAHQARCCVRVTRSATSRRTGPITLLVGHDGSGDGEAVVQAVAQRTWPENTAVRVMSFIEGAHDAAQQRQVRSKSIDDSIVCLQNAGLIASGSVVDGNPRRELVREAERSDAETIFVGAGRRSGAGCFLLGGISTAVVTRARCTIEVVR